VNPKAVRYITFSRGTNKSIAKFKVSGTRSNRDTEINTPAAKAARTPDLLLYLTAETP
jgi:hypothetical protein